MIIKLKNGETVQLAGCEEREPSYIKGQARRSLVLTLSDPRGLDALDAIFEDGSPNLDEVAVSSPEGWVPPADAPDMPAPEDRYRNFSICDRFGPKQVQVSAETSEAPAAFERRVQCVLAEMTYIERLLRDLGIQ